MRFRQQRLSFILVIMALIAGRECPADTHYVSLSGTNNSPFTNWPDASTNIIWAVNAAGVNDTVLVSNGVYYTTNHIYSTAAITLRSVNGRAVTILNGDNATTNRCVNFTSASAVFNGFTVTNYSTRGSDGVLYGYQFYNCLFVSNYCSTIPFNSGGRGTILTGSGGVITNCIFKNNITTSIGGAIYATPCNGLTLLGCWFEGNSSGYGMCALYSCRNTVISNCVAINNSGNLYSGGFHMNGGVVCTNNLIVNCVASKNTSNAQGGGIDVYGEAVVKNCIITENRVLTANGIGGGIYVLGNNNTNSRIINCLIASNSAVKNGGGIWMTNCTVENCTIVSNQAGTSGGGLYLDGVGSGTNNIIYFNTAANAANFTNTAGNAGLNYSCVIPAVGGNGNITNDPFFKNFAGGDYRLQKSSPCINKGINQSWMTGAVDLDGNVRIRYGIVDMGAYETFLRQGNIYKVH